MSVEKILVDNFEVLEYNGVLGIKMPLNDEPCKTGEFIYDGRNCAILVRNETKAFIFTNILTEIREKVLNAPSIMMIETDGEEKSFTTNRATYENGHEYIDLGLSVKWATMNVGASKAEDYGGYFAWGETEPKATYDGSTYKWCIGSTSTLTKYNTDSSFGTVDNKTQLDLSDDAARANWRGAWRMPTDAEWTELCEQCTWTWTTQNGVNGYKVKSKNGNFILQTVCKRPTMASIATR